MATLSVHGKCRSKLAKGLDGKSHCPKCEKKFFDVALYAKYKEKMEKKKKKGRGSFKKTA